MKTHNYNIDLMIPDQTDKEIIFNEAQTIFDSFCNYSVDSIMSNPPTQLKIGEKHVITHGERKNQICFCANIPGGIQYLQPKTGMIIFIKSQKNFFLYENNSWRKINLDNTPGAQTCFAGARGDFEIMIDAQILYLYMNGNSKIKFVDVKFEEFILIIKQNTEVAYKIIWDQQIIWPMNNIYELSPTLNSIHILRFYRLIETNKFLAEIVGQQYIQ